MISFLLNGRTCHIDEIDPNTTVLEYLREIRLLKGTKEGCASGDCGACTVSVGELKGDRIEYRSAMSCIGLIGSLHGKHLVTVEGLKQGGALHPVQQALVDNHASQCGFCTPGFAMSMFTLYQNGDAPSRHQAELAMDGNLCRCTGYRPIVDAALSVSLVPDDQAAQRPEWVEALREINAAPAASVSHGGRLFFAPRSAAEVAALLGEHPDAKLIAGGTDLSLEITQNLQRYRTLVYLGDAADMKEVHRDGTKITIGAAAPYSDTLEAIRSIAPDFAAVIERIGSTQIRNVGTIGGNIANASPIGDTPPALIALGAVLHLQSAGGERRVALDDFYSGYRQTVMGPGEFIRAIEVPVPVPGRLVRMYKISKRTEDDISAVCAAFSVGIQDGRVTAARVAFGGMAAVPKRALACENALKGKTWDVATIAAAGAALEDDFTPLTDVRATAGYRLAVARNLLTKCYLESVETKPSTRIQSYG